MVKVVYDVPEVDGAIVVQVKRVKVCPQVVPAVWLNHSLHRLPVRFADGVADRLYLVSRPEMETSSWENVFHFAKGSLAAHG